jgi:hypothetical protein
VLFRETLRPPQEICRSLDRFLPHFSRYGLRAAIWAKARFLRAQSTGQKWTPQEGEL